VIVMMLRSAQQTHAIKIKRKTKIKHQIKSELSIFICYEQ